MRRFVIVLSLLTGIATADAPKDPYAGWRDPIAKIIGGAYDGKVMTQLENLSDLGPRLTGTANYNKSADWAVAQLKAAGAQNVHLEKFAMKHGWQRGTAKLVANNRPIRVEAIGWAPSTAGTVRGPMVRIKLDAVPRNLKGKIGVFDLAEFPQGPGSWKVFRKALSDLKISGAAGFLGAFVAPNNVLFGAGGPIGVDQALIPLPCGVIGLEDGKWLFKQLERGPVNAELAITNTVTGPIQVPNVVGEIKGQTDEWVVIGAHLDAWDFSSGTQDNGSGVVHVLQTARLLAQAGPLKRSIRFVLWGGEEQGLLGSMAYVAAHAGELDKIAAYLNTDNGAGHVKGWKVQKRADVQAALAPIADKLLAGVGGTIDMTLTSDTDHFSFLQAGVPSLDLFVDMTAYMPIHHTAGDTMDKVDPHMLASGLAVVAVTAYALAQNVERMPRLDRKATEALLKPDGLDEMLRADGVWK